MTERDHRLKAVLKTFAPILFLFGAVSLLSSVGLTVFMVWVLCCAASNPAAAAGAAEELGAQASRMTQIVWDPSLNR